ncbi:MAG: class I SAM-dependent methyltransferase [Chitinophagales bacterium]|nr:class I SAM-dependent methyltransferase [Chitinophagales bacterium]
MRKPFQGVGNIIRFNWQFYVLAIVATVILFLVRNNFNAALRAASDILVVVIIGSTLISLLVSCYIYDFSNLYKLSWLDNLLSKDNGKIVNINAGFDETSNLLKSKFANSDLTVLDFYDPTKHTEVSIKRARKAYPPYPNTQQTNTKHLPLQDKSADKIFAILSAHEIRNDEERISFFKEIHRVLSPTGQIIVTEHLRDTANFLAYNIGAFHFHSKTTWLKTFQSAGLRVADEIKITPFITTFILDRNGTAS